MAGKALSVDKALRRAKALEKTGDILAAQQIYHSILEKFPTNKRALDGLNGGGRATQKAVGAGPTQQEAEAVAALYRQGRLNAALAQCSALVARYPGVFFLHNLLGAVHAALNRTEEAVACYRRAVTLAPGEAEPYNNLAVALTTLGRHDEALASIREALRLRPDYAEAHNNIGLTLGYLGRSKDAAASFERAIALTPGYAEAYRHLSDVKKFTAGDPEIAAMQRALASTHPRSGAAMHLNFALGKAADDAGDHDAAFSHFAQGNRLRKKELGYDIAQDRKLFETIKSLFQTDLPDIPGGESAKRMIFVLGMPRSGTSLVEQILASHSQVHGAGELDLLRQGVAPFLTESDKAMTCESLAALRTDYMAGIDRMKVCEPVATDKLPTNFRFIGFILTAFPEATVIHTRRDPVATCWSIFRHFFPSRGLGFAWDLADLAEYYRLYEDLMAFWHDRFPGRIHDVDYDLLTENQNAQSRRLVADCGLDWEDACIHFHKTSRGVSTASSLQVREKMYRGSSNAWRKYEKHLQPLIEALGLSAGFASVAGEIGVDRHDLVVGEEG